MIEKFSVNMLGVGLSGNENVYIAGIVKYNDFISALMIVKENEIFNPTVNEVIVKLKEIWEASANIAAFNVKLNGVTKYRIMPWGVTKAIENKSNADDTIEELKTQTMKFFNEIEVYKKDHSPEKIAADAAEAAEAEVE